MQIERLERSTSPETTRAKWKHMIVAIAACTEARRKGRGNELLRLHRRLVPPSRLSRIGPWLLSVRVCQVPYPGDDVALCHPDCPRPAFCASLGDAGSSTTTREPTRAIMAIRMDESGRCVLVDIAIPSPLQVLDQMGLNRQLSARTAISREMKHSVALVTAWREVIPGPLATSPALCSVP